MPAMSWKQVDRAVLAAGEIFDEALEQALLEARLFDDGGNFGLAKRLVGFEPPLPADEVVARASRSLSPRATVTGFLRPTSRMLSAISLNERLLRTRGLMTVISAIGISSTVFSCLPVIRPPSGYWCGR